jgi:uncharacterized protein
LEDKSVHLEGELPAEELDPDTTDELVKASEPLRYDLEVEENGQNLLVRGQLSMELDCACARCLKPFKYLVEIDPYDALIPLEGEEKAAVMNDLVDLTPYLREDTLLAFPQHPLCEAECDRLPQAAPSKPSANPPQGQKSAWDELNKLKF